jgi:uncharacterized protein (TIGR03083 family)
MSRAGISGMQAAGDQLLNIATKLTDEQWQAESAAAGWSVQDVFIHVGSLLELLQAAVAGADVPPIGIEELNNLVVAQHRDWTPSQTVQFLRDQLSAAVGTFTSLQEEPFASTLAPMLDLGSYPLHAIADMFTFDITTHLHYDVLGQRGPVALPHPCLDEVQLGPAVSWLLGGISQMQPGLADHLRGPISLRLTGPGGRQVLLTSGDNGPVVSPQAETDVHAAATVTSTTQDFLAWSTKRLPWSELVHLDGDETVAAEFLDALNLI